MNNSSIQKRGEFSLEIHSSVFEVFAGIDYLSFNNMDNEDYVSDLLVANKTSESFVRVKLKERKIVTYEVQNVYYRNKLFSKEFEDTLNYLLCNTGEKDLIVDLDTNLFVYNLTDNTYNRKYFGPISDVIDNYNYYFSEMKKPYSHLLVIDDKFVNRVSSISLPYLYALKSSINLLKDTFDTESRIISTYVISHYNEINKVSDICFYIPDHYRIRGKREIISDKYVNKVDSNSLLDMFAAKKQEPPSIVVNYGKEKEEMPSIFLSDLIESQTGFKARKGKAIVINDLEGLLFKVDKMFYEYGTKKLYVYTDNTNIMEVKKQIRYKRIVIVNQGTLIQNKEVM